MYRTNGAELKTNRRAIRRVLARALLAVALVGAGLAGGIVWSELKASATRGAKPADRAESAGESKPAPPGAAPPAHSTGESAAADECQRRW